MRYYQIVVEQKLDEKLFYQGPLKLPYGGTTDTVIYQNPSRFELKKIKARAKDGALRGLLDGNMLLVWPAHDATHSEIAHALKVDGADLHLNDDYIEVNDFDPDVSDEQAAEFAREIKEHPTIIALYGAGVRIYIEADSGAVTWDF